MTDDLRVWRASQSDSELISRLPRFGATRFDLVEELATPHARVYLARRGAHEVVGALLAWQLADELEVLDLATLPVHRRQGVGGALLDAALNDARRDRFRLVLLEVRRSNAAAIGLYASRGFASAATRTGYYADGEDALEMRLQLDECIGLPAPISDEAAARET